MPLQHVHNHMLLRTIRRLEVWGWNLLARNETRRLREEMTVLDKRTGRGTQHTHPASDYLDNDGDGCKVRQQTCLWP